MRWETRVLYIGLFVITLLGFLLTMQANGSYAAKLNDLILPTRSYPLEDGGGIRTFMIESLGLACVLYEKPGQTALDCVPLADTIWGRPLP